MSRLPAFLLFLCLVATGVSAQQTVTGTAVAARQPVTGTAVSAPRSISGTVVDGGTGKPVPGASVFISNTSKGTVSDRNGAFVLTELPVGQQELIVSSIGFETNSYAFTSEQLPLKVLVKLQVKVKELENVMVEPSVMEGWDRWGKLFTDQFVGNTPNAARCKIKNYKAVRFRYFKKSNRVIAWCDEPIIIENKALGYTLRYQLENFEVNFTSGATTYAGYPFFEDHQGSKKKVRSRWQRRRNEAYTGSMQQFMRSLYNNTLEADGFEVKRMVRTPNYEKKRVQALYRAGLVVQRKDDNNPRGVKLQMAPARKTVSMGSASLTIQSSPATLPAVAAAADSVAASKSPDGMATSSADSSSLQKTGNAPPAQADSAAYYERILAQEDNIDVYGRTLLTADSLIIERSSTARAVWFDNYLYITFRKETEDQLYLDFHHERRSPTFQRSYIWLVNKEPVVIDAKGSYSPAQEVFAMSYWGWSEKMSDLLPIDFEPTTD